MGVLTILGNGASVLVSLVAEKERDARFLICASQTWIGDRRLKRLLIYVLSRVRLGLVREGVLPVSILTAQFFYRNT